MPDDETLRSRRDFLELSAATLTGALLPDVGHGEGQSRASGAASTAGIDLTTLTIADAGTRLAKKQWSPTELMRATLSRIEALNPRVGAFITVSADRAMDAARLAEQEIARGRSRGPLHGIPVGVKDTHYQRGVTTTAGSYVLRDFVPAFDATIVARLQSAGAIVVGKTNLPEFSFGGVTPSCHNPWDLARNSGGSSGGSGAALAASMLIGATGGDTSGSIRNPAATCGVVGLKPTFGLVSRYGVVPISWTLDHLGPMARTVEDTAILLNAIAGHDPLDPFSARHPRTDYRERLHRSLEGLRVGVLADVEMQGFHPDTVSAFRAAVKVFEQEGALLREVKYAERTKIAADAQGIIRICEAATYHRQFLRGRADEYRHIMDPAGAGGSDTRTTVEAGSLLTATQYLLAQKARTLFLRDVHQVFSSLDVLIEPTMPSPAGVQARGAQAFRNWFDLSGFPAVSLPCGFSTDPPGLPIGLQISAKPFDDALVLAVAFTYERATDWHARRPGL